VFQIRKTIISYYGCTSYINGCCCCNQFIYDLLEWKRRYQIQCHDAILE